MRILGRWIAVAAFAAARGASPGPAAAQADATAQFLADKDVDLVAVVQAETLQSRWVLVEGDHVPIGRVRFTMIDPLVGGESWPDGLGVAVAQIDYTNMVDEPLSPPVIEGRRYLLFADRIPREAGDHWNADWIARAQGVLLVRGSEPSSFVYWEGARYPMADIRRALRTGPPPLDGIADPALRIQIARERLQRGRTGDVEAFIGGLLALIEDPEGGASRVRRARPPHLGADVSGMEEVGPRPHELWYESVALLRDLGRLPPARKQVVAALAGLVQTGAERVRLPAALALADLGDATGTAVLAAALEAEPKEVSRDPASAMTLPGRYPYDHSSTEAAAHALARLGDRRGLGHANADVRLATAESLREVGDSEIDAVLRSIAAGAAPELARLRESGELTKPRSRGDYTTRHPASWTRARALLAGRGDDESLRELALAYLEDAGTYPKEDRDLVPIGRPMMWSADPSPAEAIRGSGTPAETLARLERLFGGDPRWDGSAFRSLRSALSDPADEEEGGQADVTPEQVAALLKDAVPDRRAQGLAAAGYHGFDQFFDVVLDAASRGTGVEHDAAVYALTFYERSAPEPLLRKLVEQGSPLQRLTALDLATRDRPEPFAEATLGVTRAVLAEAGRVGDAPGGFDVRHSVEQLPRLIARFGRRRVPAEILSALRDPDPAVRLVVARGLGLSGNPSVAGPLQELSTDPDPQVRQAASQLLTVVGPAE